jgi:IclR family pca regulon transcriptional regulator
VRNSSGAVVAAMNLSAQAARVSRREMESRFLSSLRSAADEVGHLLLR